MKVINHLVEYIDQLWTLALYLIVIEENKSGSFINVNNFISPW